MEKQVKDLIEECKNLIEQGEPFQRKMKAKHSRLKKRVIGHGGQANTPPYSEKPSMKRSKSAPPIGEGFGDFFSFMTTKPKEQPKKTEYKYEEGKDYNHVFGNIYVGAAPISGGKIIDSALQTFGLIIVMSDQVADIIKRNKIPNNVVLDYAIRDTNNPTPEEKTKLVSAGLMAKKQSSNKKVLIVCSQGLNRSVAAACLSMREFGLQPEEAIKKAKDARGQSALTLNLKPHSGFLPIIKNYDPNDPYGEKKLQETIRKKGSKFCLYSKKSNKNLGCYTSRKGAEEREREVQYFKHAKKKS